MRKRAVAPKNRGKRKIGTIVYRTLLAVFFGVVCYALFFSGFLSINNIEIRGVEQIEADVIKKDIYDMMQGSYAKAVAKNNILFMRPSVIETELKDRFKKIRDIDIRRKFPSSLIVSIRERRTAFILCNEKDCFNIDEDGQVYENVSADREDIMADRASDGPVVIRDLGNREIVSGEYIFNRGYLDFISNLKNELKDKLDIDVQNAYDTPNRVSADVRVQTVEGWKIIFNGEIGLQKELDMLSTVLDNTIGKSQRPNLEYVDLRSDNKVYYKLKDGSQEEVNNQGEGNFTKPEEKKDVKGGSDKKKKKSQA